MSYILDALKKSDKQRQQEHVPDLNTVQVEQPPAKKPKFSWPIPLAVILLLNAAFVLYVVFRPQTSSSPEVETVAEHGAEQSRSFKAQQNQQAVPAVTPSATSVNNRDTGLVDPAEFSGADNVVEQQEAQVTVQEHVPAKQGEIPANPTEDFEDTATQLTQDGPEEAGPENLPLNDESAALAVFEDDVSPSQQAGFVPPEMPAAPEETTSPEPQVSLAKKALHIHQLPDSIQQQLPEIHIDAHLFYKDRPTARFASINGQIMREGDILDTNLKIAEISPEGVVFSFQEYLFYVPVF